MGKSDHPAHAPCLYLRLVAAVPYITHPGALPLGKAAPARRRWLQPHRKAFNPPIKPQVWGQSRVSATDRRESSRRTATSRSPFLHHAQPTRVCTAPWWDRPHCWGGCRHAAPGHPLGWLHFPGSTQWWKKRWLPLTFVLQKRPSLN